MLSKLCGSGVALQNRPDWSVEFIISQSTYKFIVTVALVSLLAEQTFTFGARTGTFSFTRG